MPEPQTPETSRDAANLPELVSELWELVVAYAKQETVEPIRGLGRFVVFGVAGSVLLGIGLVILLLAVLRALQTETGTTFEGNWSWAPYLITIATGLLLVALTLAGTRSKGGSS